MRTNRGTLYGPHWLSSGLGWQFDLGQPGRYEPDHPAGHARLDRPDLPKLRHERGRLHDVPPGPSEAERAARRERAGFPERRDALHRAVLPTLRKQRDGLVINIGY